MTDARSRLLHLRELNDAAGDQMRGEAARFASLANRKPARAISANNLFQTPPAIAARMVALAHPADGMRVLEPSAGLGRILGALADTGARLDITAVEQSTECCAELYEQHSSATLRQGDFLEIAPTLGAFDRVVMNPPFRRGADIGHILAARDLLAPDGLLVALCYDGVRQNRTLRELADTWDVLPRGSFLAEGTSASVVLLTIPVLLRCNP